MTAHNTRYPLEPLATHLGIQLGQIGGHQPGQHPTGMAALAERLGIAPRVLQRHRRHGLTATLADRYAIRIGAHPAMIWPTWFQDTPDDLHGAAAHNARKTQCPAGHPYDHIDAHGARRCRQCTTQAVKRCRQNHKHAGQHNDYTQQDLPGVHT